MDEHHPHSGATYKIILRKDMTFGVEVTIPGMAPTTVSGFATETDAERWIGKHKEEVAGSNSMRRRFKVWKR